MKKEIGKLKLTSELRTAVDAIKSAILQGQYEAAKGVNRIQLALYYGIGKYVSEQSKKMKWGTGAIKLISEQLQKEMPGLRGFGDRQIRNMQKFYTEWRKCIILQPVAAKLENDDLSSIQTDILLPLLMQSAVNLDPKVFTSLSFTHHIEIVDRVKLLDERLYYIRQSYLNHWTKYELRDHIKWDDYHHQGGAPSNFSQTLTPRQAVKAISTFKDEYLLDFINVEEVDEHDNMCVNERVVEQEIVQNIKRFIMTFGRKFCFIGNQYHLRADNYDFFVDLLFFNRELNCLVAIELKAGKFKIPYLGELQTYLRILDEQEKGENENPSIGLILCKDADRNLVEYMIRDYTKPMGVATYKTMADMPEHIRKALPDVEELKKLL